MESDYSVNSSELGSECDPDLLLKMADDLPPVEYYRFSDDNLPNCGFNMLKSNDDLQTYDMNIYNKNQDVVLTQLQVNKMSVDEHLQKQLGSATQDETSVPALPPEELQPPMCDNEALKRLRKTENDSSYAAPDRYDFPGTHDFLVKPAAESFKLLQVNKMSVDERLQNQLGTATQDETSVPALPPEELQPPMDSSYAAPDRYNFPGTYDFVVKPAAESFKLYSSKDETMYVERNHKFSLLFSWDHSRTQRMYVRATPVYQFIRDSTVRPETCDKHKTEIDETANHIVQSCTSRRSEGLSYCGDPHLPDSWFSVVHERSSSGTHDYKSVCSKTCLGGRPISVIYTLEDPDGNVVGRQTVKFNISESASRDKRIKEAKSQKKRVMSKEVPIKIFERIRLDNILAKSKILEKVMKKFKAAVKRQIKRLR